MWRQIRKFVRTRGFSLPSSGVALFCERASPARRLRRTSSESARFIRIFSPALFADKARQSQNDLRSCRTQAFGSRSLGERPGARHTGVAGSDCVDRRTSRPAASEAFVTSDHSLLSNHGTCGATGILRVLETGAGSFSPLVERVAPFLLFRRYDFGPRLFIAWRIQQILHHNSRKRSVAAPK